LLVNSVPLSDTHSAGRPRRPMRLSSSRTTRRPGSDVSATSAQDPDELLLREPATGQRFPTGQPLRHQPSPSVDGEDGMPARTTRRAWRAARDQTRQPHPRLKAGRACISGAGAERTSAIDFRRSPRRLAAYRGTKRSSTAVLRRDGWSDLRALLTKRGGAQALLIAFDLVRLNGDSGTYQPPDHLAAVNSA
jgi:hypothetical protein